MDYLKYAIGAGILWFIGSQIYAGYKKGVAGDNGKLHCITCGTDAEPITETRGSIWIELVLWLCFIVPGVIYSIWRLTSKRETCSACKASNLVPYASPAAVKHRKTLSE